MNEPSQWVLFAEDFGGVCVLFGLIVVFHLLCEWKINRDRRDAGLKP